MEDKDKALNVARTLKNSGSSLEGIAKRLNTEGLKTPNGHTWTIGNVSAFLTRNAEKKSAESKQIILSKGKKQKAAKAKQGPKKPENMHDFAVNMACKYLRDKNISSKDRIHLAIRILRGVK